MTKTQQNKLIKWYNINYTQLKIKKSGLEKLKSTINTNSRIFYSTLRKISKIDPVESTIQDVENKVSPPKSKKKTFWKVVLLLLNIALVVGVFVSFAKEQGGVHDLASLLANKPRWWFLIIAVGLYFATVVFNSLKFFFLIHARTKKWRPILAMKVAIIGRYYDLITPLGSGGQPFEIYYLKKNGLSGDDATAIPLAKYMIWQVSFIMLCLFILLIYSKNYISAPIVLILAWVGLSVNLLLFLFIFLMSITKKWCASLVVGILKLLHKMKIIKNYKKSLVKVLRFVQQYQTSIKNLTKQPLLIISEILVTMASLICHSVIAYFVYATFEVNPIVTWWDIVCKCSICDLAVCFIPLPGGSGAQELSFNSLLGSLFPEGALFWGVLFWRILTYYAYIINGAIVLIVDSIISKHKTKRKIE